MAQRLQKLTVILAALGLLLVLWAARTPPADEGEGRPAQARLTAEGAPTSRAASVADLQGTLLFECQRALCLLDIQSHTRSTLEPSTPSGRYLAPRWSPDGERFAALYAPTLAVERRNTTTGSSAQTAETTQAGSLVLFSAQGEQRAGVLLGEHYLLDPAPQLVWSPTGQQLAALVQLDRDGNGDPDLPAQILVFSLDGGITLADSMLSGAAYPPGWSGDGRWLAYTRTSAAEDGTRKSEVWAWDAERASTQRLADGVHPAWQPGQQRLTFISPDGTELRRIDLQSREKTTLLTTSDIAAYLARDEPTLPRGRLRFARPVWSPDGANLAFRIWGEPLEEWSEYIPGMLFTSAANGGQLQRWPDTDTGNTAAQIWSPTGSHLIYPYWLIGQERFSPRGTTPAPEERFTYSCAMGLVLVDIRHSSYRQDICGSVALEPQSFGSWSPDGRVFAARSGSAITTIVVDDPAQHSTIAAPRPRDIQWRPRPDK